MNIISFFSLILMTVGIVITVLTRKKPHKFIVWSVIVCTALQFLSFLMFSGIMEKKSAFGFVFLGLLIGAVCGVFVKFTKTGKDIFYRQGTAFTVIYLSILYLNQLIAFFFIAYIPFIILLSAISMGLYAGMNIVLLARSKKIRRIHAAMIIMLILTAAVSSSLTAFAEDDGYNYNAALAAYAKDWEESSNTVYENIPTDVGLKTKSVHTLEWIKYPYIEDGKVWLSLKIWEEEYYDTDTVWYNSESGEYVSYPAGAPHRYVSYLRNADAPDWEITVDDLKSRYPEFSAETEQVTTTYLEEDYGEYAVDSTEQTTYLEGDYGEYVIDGDGTDNEQTVPPEEKNNDSGLFYIQFVEYDTAGASIISSGFFSSIGALLGALMGLPKGMAPVSNYGYTAKDAPELVNQIINKNSEGSQQNAVHPGARRNDGKIYTKNSGWVNEYSTEQQINSNNNSIDYFRKKIEQYRANGDKNNLAAAEDTVKELERKNRYLNEDMNAIKSTRIKENMVLNDSSATRTSIYADYLDAGYDTSKGISFASDIGLAIGTAGASTALGSAKTVITVLTTAKDIADTGADAYEAFRTNKSAVQFISEQTAKRIVGKAIGTEFDKGKLLYGIENSKSTFLKVLAASGETSSNYSVNELADKSGVYENFGKGMNNMTGWGDKK